jgi:hypothetical protein
VYVLYVSHQLLRNCDVMALRLLLCKKYAYMYHSGSVSSFTQYRN